MISAKEARGISNGYHNKKSVLNTIQSMIKVAANSGGYWITFECEHFNSDITYFIFEGYNNYELHTPLTVQDEHSIVDTLQSYGYDVVMQDIENSTKQRWVVSWDE